VFVFVVELLKCVVVVVVIIIIIITITITITSPSSSSSQQQPSGSSTSPMSSTAAQYSHSSSALLLNNELKSLKLLPSPDPLNYRKAKTFTVHFCDFPFFPDDVPLPPAVLPLGEKDADAAAAPPCSCC
jgi:hypothetical protein